MRTALGISRALTAAFALVVASSAFAADGDPWWVKRTSGEVWMGSGDVQQASLKTDETLKPGDTIRTGRNGRVLLVRGEESILIAPNSVVGLPSETKETLSTTIRQQAGSILLEVEKKDVKHFEVETPYLAAVVKGTQFRVTVTAAGAKVDVVRGQVEVADFKTGQIAQVMPGQHATTFSSGKAGLSLGGSGLLAPIQQGQPRASTIDRVTVPRNGLTPSSKPGPASSEQRQASSGPRPGVIRISSSLGEVRVNVHRVTHGLARSASAVAGNRSMDNRETSTVWASGDTGSSTPSQSGNNSNAGGNAGSAGNAVSAAASGVAGVTQAAVGGVSSVVSTVGGVVGSATGGGNGNGLALGLGNGNGRALALGLGNGNGLGLGLGRNR